MEETEEQMSAKGVQRNAGDDGDDDDIDDDDDENNDDGRRPFRFDTSWQGARRADAAALL